MAFHARQITLEVVAFIYIPAKPNDHAGLFILGHIGLSFVFVFVLFVNSSKCPITINNLKTISKIFLRA